MKVPVTPETGLLIVDVQNDFCPGGSLPVARGDEVVDTLSQLAHRFSAGGRRVIATRDWHPANHVSFQANGGPWPPHCVQNTKGAEYHPRLVLPPRTDIVTKGDDPKRDALSAFQGETETGRLMVDLLRVRGVSKLVVGGLATDYCVKASVLDARKNHVETVVLTDLVRAVEAAPGDGERALEEMKRAGALLATSADLVF